ncbi:hypothetical protein BACPEC_01040 [[Bacteroides] pectinophilus ATCC 43243]|uniref:Uncharacterized protein n=1 Tax=[Bacteroides] pectinophilus ATCC 43243 TaxID=483218 RepID=B7AQT3_9FIRM|nr:hypothetical protein BACPEC_01040 [[Bacteroides] pectinophilus ATCC 43243]
MNSWKEKLHVVILKSMNNIVFKCPNCGAKITVPRGHGIICIKCPECRIEFNKRHDSDNHIIIT